MEILSLYNQSGFNIEGIWEERIDYNDHYRASVLRLPSKTKTISFGDRQAVQTFYVLNGNVGAYFSTDPSNEEFEHKKFEKGQGWSLMPNQRLSLNVEKSCQLFTIRGSGDFNSLKDDTGENPIAKQYRIQGLSNYSVNKPWGSEAWFVNNGIYVLKGITMIANNESSLQVHEQKIEANLILRGRARVALGFDEKVKEVIVNHTKSGGTQSNFSLPKEDISRVVHSLPVREFGQRQGWIVRPHQIHRVFSMETYFALEVSTPEVDDVIRLKDLHHRPGGRIEEEHIK